MTQKQLSKRRILAASLLGSIVSLQLGAFSVVLQTLVSGVSELPFHLFVLAMQPIHLAIGIVEGLITSAVLCFIYSVRPNLLWRPHSTEALNNALPAPKISLRSTLSILSITTLMIGGFLSLFASSNPDGLEWSIAKMPNVTEELSRSGAAYQTAEALQTQTALLPDYAFKNSDTLLGTSVSGIVGCFVVFGLCLLLGSVLYYLRKKGHQVSMPSESYDHE